MTTLQTELEAPEAVSGVQLAQGIGVQEARGFWADAWSTVLKRRGALFGLGWIVVIGFFAAFAPLIANGHPLVMTEFDAAGNAVKTTYPLWEHLRAVDLLMIAGAILAPLWLLIPMPMKQSERLRILLMVALQAGFTVVISQMLAGQVSKRDVAPWVRQLDLASWFPPVAAAGVAVMIGALFLAVPTQGSRLRKLAIVAFVAVLSALAVSQRWKDPLVSFNYRAMEASGRIKAVYTLIPFSPNQGDTELYVKEPGTTLNQARDVEGPDTSPTFVLGTDGLGQDVLSQMLHACRLSISIGLVSTGIAVVIGVSVGAIAGYFGGRVDLLLQRVIEIFMAIPVLFLLIVAAGVLPPEMRTTYVMMAIIGCFTWTSAARFTRAEFYKLRNQDFVQSAKSVGLPLPSILFKHMLPNGVTPVLVDASFLIASAILAEAVLSFLGLGPVGQPSWGKLLSSATGMTGNFIWWLAIFPGAAIFLTVLSYNLIGEALRDAIDPKLKKARV